MAGLVVFFLSFHFKNKQSGINEFEILCLKINAATVQMQFQAVKQQNKLVTSYKMSIHNVSSSLGLVSTKTTNWDKCDILMENYTSGTLWCIRILSSLQSRRWVPPVWIHSEKKICSF